MLAVTRCAEICIGIVCAGIVLAGTDFGSAQKSPARHRDRIHRDGDHRPVHAALALAGPEFPDAAVLAGANPACLRTHPVSTRR